MAPEAIERICSPLLQHCIFHDTWDTVDNKMIIEVFGKRSAERQALLNHQNMIEASGVPLVLSQAEDEMCLTESNMLRVPDYSATRTLNKMSREPENLILYDINTKLSELYPSRFIHFQFANSNQ